MKLKALSAVFALIGTASSAQMPFGYHHTFELLSNTIATSGWERASAIVTGPTYITSDNIYRNTTWSIELPSHLQDIVRKSAPFEWTESAGGSGAIYGFHIRENTTGYVAQALKWHVLTGYIRTKQNDITIMEELVTTISPKVLRTGEQDGAVTFIKIN
ncbi:hypothetical protein DFQ26_004146 [Actinomortierella ambigua]|nr:hypothetical protein DFQ26_004146 [Actinomortierella ambigua]